MSFYAILDLTDSCDFFLSAVITNSGKRTSELFSFFRGHLLESLGDPHNDGDGSGGRDLPPDALHERHHVCGGEEVHPHHAFRP